MTRESQQQSIKFHRTQLIKELEKIYLKSFERIANIELKEKDVAKLTQIFLQSKEGALLPLLNEIEKPLITKAPKN